LGLAVGDALGTSLEFTRPGSFEPITDMIGGGPFGLEAGQWTDDTSMALCLAESLVECRGFDPVDQLSRYVRWYREGHNSSTVRHRYHDAQCSPSLRGDRRAGVRINRPSFCRQRVDYAPRARSSCVCEQLERCNPLLGRKLADNPRCPRGGGRVPLIRADDRRGCPRRGQGCGAH
jgi:hypothetical protein